MLCKKCNEEIYSNDKCPFCGQLQSQPLEIKVEQNNNKDCYTCSTQYSIFNEECQKCSAKNTKNNQTTQKGVNFPSSCFGCEKKNLLENKCYTCQNTSCTDCFFKHTLINEHCMKCGHKTTSTNKYRNQTVNKKSDNSGCFVAIVIIVLIICGSITALTMLGNNVKGMFRDVNTQLEQTEENETIQPVVSKEDAIYLIDLIGSSIVEIEKTRVSYLHAILNYIETGEEPVNYYEEYVLNNEEKIQALDNYNIEGLIQIKDKFWQEYFIPMTGQGLTMLVSIKTNDMEKFYTQMSYFPDLNAIQNDFRTIAQLGGLSEEEFFKKICHYGIEFGKIHKNDKVIPTSETDYEIIQKQEDFCKQYIE